LGDGRANRANRANRTTPDPGQAGNGMSTHKVRNMRSVMMAANTASGTNITGTHS
jgi:hypothetical protein